MQKNVAILQLSNKREYQKNLDELIDYIKKIDKNFIIVAPEVCLTDYDYENLQKACEFSEYAISKLLPLIDNQILVLTLLRKYENFVVNEAIVLHKNKIVHSQQKHKLFKLGNEHKYLKAGKKEDIKIFEIDGVKYGVANML